MRFVEDQRKKMGEPPLVQFLKPKKQEKESVVLKQALKDTTPKPKSRLPKPKPYHKVSDEIESRGGRVLRVRLDYEIKDELYPHIARTAKEKGRAEVAERYHLKVVSGKIPIPDLRLEYVNENDNQIQHRDLELATDRYRPRGLAEKARAGFQIYARPEETSRLRPIRDGRELTAAIYSL